METLKYDVEGHFLAEEEQIGVITLNRPEVLNGINHQMLKEFNELLDKIEKDDNIRAVIIRSASEKVFSSGADLKAAATFMQKPEEGRKFMAAGQTLYRRIENFPKPIIAELNALVIGGGLEMAMACDLRVAAKDSKLWHTEVVNIGLIPGWGGTQRLPKLVGLGRAKEIILTGRQIPADEAFEIGLVNKVFDSIESLHEGVNELATKLVEKAGVAIKLAKQSMNNAWHLSLPDNLAFEVNVFCQTFDTEDKVEGVAAFLEKRKAEFKHR